MRVVNEREVADAAKRTHKRRGGRRAFVVAATLVAVLAVAAGVLARSFGLVPLGGSARAGAARGAAPTTTTQAYEFLPDRSRPTPCVIPPQQPRMLTPADLATPVQQGTRLDENGHPQPCQKPGLAIPDVPGGAPEAAGQAVVVSLGQQWLWAFDDGKLVFANPVTTGQEWLWTPQGTYHIQYKVQDTWFYSPWPPGSPYYYTPEHVNYALYFRDNGYYIHDAPWRHAFGPGTNVPHTNPDGTQEDGSHGCVNVATTAGKWLFDWTQVGATVIITD